MPLTRCLEAVLVADLAAHDKMLFLAGPRQSGKTTLARTLSTGAGRLPTGPNLSGKISVT